MTLLSLKHLCSQLYNLQGLAVYEEKVPFVLCGNLAALRISYSKAGKYDNDIFITQLKLGQPRWHHAFMHSAQKHTLPNCAEPDLAAGNGRKSGQSSFQLCWYVYSLSTHTSTGSKSVFYLWSMTKLEQSCELVRIFKIFWDWRVTF